MELPYIASLKHQLEIDAACSQIKNCCGLDYLIVYILFRNSQIFVLSNVYAHLADYYQNDMYKHDFSTSKSFFENNNYYICSNDKGISAEYSNLLRNKYAVHRVFYKRYQTPEFDLIFGAANRSPIEDKMGFYKKSAHDFDNFVLSFMKNNYHIFRAHNPELKNSPYFSNPSALKLLFQEVEQPNLLSSRERECLILAAKGYTTNDASKILGISKHTIEEYRKAIMIKLNAVNMTNAVYNAMKQDLLEDSKIILPNVDSVLSFRNLNMR